MSVMATLKNREMRGMIFHLAWPTLLEQALQTLVHYADTAQVGAIGANASAAVGLTASTTWLISGPQFALGMGALSLIARALGAKDEEKAQKAAAQSVFLCVILGLFLTAATLAVSPFLPDLLGAEESIKREAVLYFSVVCASLFFRCATIVFGAVLRGAGNTKTPMLVNVFLNFLNIFLNFLLIQPSRTLRFLGQEISLWGAGLGVLGAAIATSVSFLLGGILMTLALCRSPLFRFKKADLIPHKETIKECLRVAIPVAGQRMASSLGQVVFTSLIASLGTAAMAAHSIAITAEQAFYIPGYGMQAAAATLAGNSAGAKDKKSFARYTSAITFIAVLIISVLSVFLFLFPQAIMSIFTPDKEVIELGAKALKIVAVSEPFFASMIIFEGALSGAGEAKMPFFISLFCMWGLRLTLSALCVHVLSLGLAAVWVCMVVDNLARFTLLLLTVKKGKWRKKVFAK